MLYALLVREIPTDFLAVDQDLAERWAAAAEHGEIEVGSFSQMVMSLGLRLGLSRRVVEAAIQILVAIVLAVAARRRRLGSPIVVLILAMTLFLPSHMGALARRLHVLRLDLLFVLLSLAPAVFFRRRQRAQGVACVSGCLLLLAVGGSWVVGERVPLDPTDAGRRGPSIFATAGDTPIAEVMSVGRRAFEAVTQESLVRDRVRLPDAAAFLRVATCAFLPLAALAHLAAFGAWLSALRRRFRGDAKRDGWPPGFSLSITLFCLVGWQGIEWILVALVAVSPLALLDAAMALMPDRSTRASRGRSLGAASGWTLLALVVLPNLVDLDGSAFVGRRILPASDRRLAVDVGGRDCFVTTVDRDLELAFPHALVLAGGALELDVENVAGRDRASFDVVVFARRIDGAPVELRRSFSTQERRIRITADDLLRVDAVRVGDAADRGRIRWHSIAVVPADSPR